MVVQITNGVMKYGRTVKTGDFENKRGDVELSFNIPEGSDHEAVEKALNAVEEMAQDRLYRLIGMFAPEVAAMKEAPPRLKPGPKPGARRNMPPVMPTQTQNKPQPEHITSAALMEEPVKETLPVDIILEEQKVIEPISQVVDDLNDMMGTDVPQKEITDADLLAAMTRTQARVNNAPGIRKVLNDFGIKSPPGRVIDLPQEKRQAYLDKLDQLKPLA